MVGRRVEGRRPSAWLLTERHASSCVFAPINSVRGVLRQDFRLKKGAAYAVRGLYPQGRSGIRVVSYKVSPTHVGAPPFRVDTNATNAVSATLCGLRVAVLTDKIPRGRPLRGGSGATSYGVSAAEPRPVNGGACEATHGGVMGIRHGLLEVAYYAKTRDNARLYLGRSAGRSTHCCTTLPLKTLENEDVRPPEPA